LLWALIGNCTWSIQSQRPPAPKSILKTVSASLLCVNSFHSFHRKLSCLSSLVSVARTSFAHSIAYPSLNRALSNTRVRLMAFSSVIQALPTTNAFNCLSNTDSSNLSRPSVLEQYRFMSLVCLYYYPVLLRFYSYVSSWTGIDCPEVRGWACWWASWRTLILCWILENTVIRLSFIVL